MENKEQQESFVFYKSFYESIDGLPEKNQLELLKTICEYSLYRNEPQLTGLTKNMLAPVSAPSTKLAPFGKLVLFEYCASDTSKITIE